MSILLRLLSAFVPSVSAAQIEQLGRGTPGIDAMWGMIVNTFPHTGVTNGVQFIAFRIIDFILKSISGLAVVVILYAAIKIITGGEEGVTNGKKILLYAVIGLIAAMCADALVHYTCIIVWNLSNSPSAAFGPGVTPPNCPVFLPLF